MRLTHSGSSIWWHRRLPLHICAGRRGDCQEPRRRRGGLCKGRRWAGGQRRAAQGRGAARSLAVKQLLHCSVLLPITAAPPVGEIPRGPAWPCVGRDPPAVQGGLQHLPPHLLSHVHLPERPYQTHETSWGYVVKARRALLCTHTPPCIAQRSRACAVQAARQRRRGALPPAQACHSAPCVPSNDARSTIRPRPPPSPAVHPCRTLGTRPPSTPRT